MDRRWCGGLNSLAWCLRDVSVCLFKPLQFSAASYNMHTFHNSQRAMKTYGWLRIKTPLCVQWCHAFMGEMHSPWREWVQAFAAAKRGDIPGCFGVLWWAPLWLGSRIFHVWCWLGHPKSPLVGGISASTTPSLPFTWPHHFINTEWLTPFGLLLFYWQHCATWTSTCIVFVLSHEHYHYMYCYRRVLANSANNNITTYPSCFLKMKLERCELQCYY